MPVRMARREIKHPLWRMWSDCSVPALLGVGELVQLLGKTAWQDLVKLIVCILYNSAIQLLWQVTQSDVHICS